MRLACVDVGSNTTRLLVAEPIPAGLRGLHNERLFTLIGRSIDAEGRIPADKIDETAAAVANQAERARRMGAEAMRVVATAAIRRAANAGELAEAVEQRAERSAGGALRRRRGSARVQGSRAGARRRSGSLAVVDVGGGSTEIAFGDPDGRIAHATSVPIGSSTLAERHLTTDPPTMEQIAAARADVAEAFREPRDAARRPCRGDRRQRQLARAPGRARAGPGRDSRGARPARQGVGVGRRRALRAGPGAGEAPARRPARAGGAGAPIAPAAPNL